VPEGRMLGKAVSQSKKLATLSSDTVRLIYTWTIPHLDREGRIKGDTGLFRSQVCPRLDISLSEIEETLEELRDAELIFWYAGEDGDMYIQVTNFYTHQPNWKKDREAPSRFPAPDPELVRSRSGVGQPNELTKEVINKDYDPKLSDEFKGKVLKKDGKAE